MILQKDVKKRPVGGVKEEEELMFEPKKRVKKTIRFHLDIESPAEIVVREVEIDRKAWRKEFHDEM